MRHYHYLFWFMYPVIRGARTTSQPATCDSAEDDDYADLIDLGVGYPSPDLLPLDLMKKASDTFFQDAMEEDLNYGDYPGDDRYLDSLANFLTKHYGVKADPENLFLSSGNSQALDFICANMAKPGDTILVEEPTYFLAYRIFRDNHLNIEGVPMDKDGMIMEALEEKIKLHKPTLLYTIPVFHNPSGQTLSDERRKKLIELSQKYNFYIIADEVYQMLNYYEESPRAMGTMIESGKVISLGTFSKIVAPGLRLGWIQTSSEIIEKLTVSGVVISGGCPNHYTSLLVKTAIDMGLVDEHIENIKASYRAKLEIMEGTLQTHFADIAEWYCPRGGYFFWLKIKNEVDTKKLKEKAEELQTGFQQGELFSCNGGFKDYIRLSFASYNESEIKEGVIRLSSVFKES